MPIPALLAVFDVVLGEGKRQQPYQFRKLEARGWWAARKPGVIDSYLVNLNNGTCKCPAGRHAKPCKHLAEARRLEALMVAANASPPTPAPAAAVATVPPAAPADVYAALARVLIQGDLSVLSEEQRANHYMAVCDATGLNPATQPFGYIKTKNGLKLYANKNAAEQIRKRDRVSLKIVQQGRVEDLYVVTVEAVAPDGRIDSDVGAVGLGLLKGEDAANAIMKAVTKAKRRATLSIGGVGMLDESEVDSIPGAVRQVETTTVPPPVPVPTPAPQAAPPPPPAAPQWNADERLAKIKAREAAEKTAKSLADELKIPNFGDNLMKAYGKPDIDRLADEELADLVRRLQAKKASASPAQAA